jgi:hypothetical protein
LQSGSATELANMFVVGLRDPGFNLGEDKIFSYSFCTQLEFKLVGRKLLSIICKNL